MSSVIVTRSGVQRVEYTREHRKIVAEPYKTSPGSPLFGGTGVTILNAVKDDVLSIVFTPATAREFARALLEMVDGVS